jgi:hypothetical protein
LDETALVIDALNRVEDNLKDRISTAETNLDSRLDKVEKKVDCHDRKIVEIRTEIRKMNENGSNGGITLKDIIAKFSRKNMAGGGVAGGVFGLLIYAHSQGWLGWLYGG